MLKVPERSSQVLLPMSPEFSWEGWHLNSSPTSGHLQLTGILLPPPLPWDLCHPPSPEEVLVKERELEGGKFWNLQVKILS